MNSNKENKRSLQGKRMNYNVRGDGDGELERWNLEFWKQVFKVDDGGYVLTASSSSLYLKMQN
ncbi:hypothetical protein RchiOBHm_Chr2g0126851 [Rosa chinensis]|uniref:Uncharacterized protein n=1 Tax=Rosa chinensis TaxID=74649 RepID=A0A2P6RTX6_ROSCH|nr:hypothetical protein RchiOBHm_Chr2g0126851 [Rosa chinensis]